MFEYETLRECILCGSKNISHFDCVSACKKCGLVFNNPRPNMQSVSRFYSQEGKTNSWMGGDKQEKAWDRLALRRLRRVLAIKRTGRLLDVGCGIGRFINAARKVGFDVQGIELSTSAVNIAKQKYGLNLLLGDLDDIDFEIEKFDIITLWHSLEHVPYPGRTLTKIKSILVDDGYLVIAVPNDDGYWFTRRIKNLLLPQKKIEEKFSMERREIYKKWEIGYQSNEVHLSHFTPSVLNNYLNSIGFKVKHIGLDPYYVASGLSLVAKFMHYIFCNTINILAKKNCYDTILIIAQNKKD